MSLAIKQGLFKLNITDYHAILGVSLDADPKQIRLNYLKIAQKLHPDKCRSDSQKMHMASQILSKLVNPAYEQLSRKTNFAEHQLVLTQLGKRLAENKGKINVSTEAAQELLKAKGSEELAYAKLLKNLTAEQYQSLDKVTRNIAAISELNLIYLMLKSDRVATKPAATKPKAPLPPKPQTQPDKATTTQSKTTIAQESPASTTFIPEEPTPSSRVNAFVGRAQQYISKGEYDLAVTELRDALRIDPNHGVAHAVMGRAYLYKNQLTMAKVHIGKAFQAEPNNPIVLESKKALDKLTKYNSKSNAAKQDSEQKSGNSGFFSGFFGAKKK